MRVHSLSLRLWYFLIKKLSNEKWQVQCYGKDKYGIKTRRRRIVHGTKAAANRVESELNKELGGSL